jgi:hypothetical protein
VSAAAAGLLILPTVVTKAAPGAESVVARLRHDVLNPRDMNQQRRGYYEELDAGRNDNRNALKVTEPAGWNEGTKVMYRKRSDFLMSDIAPSTSGILSGVPARANQLGMRDREYSETKPPNTHRIVLLGSSHELGVGVKEEETFENQVEDRLNRDKATMGIAKWEILNMSMAGDSLLQKMLRLEQVGFAYQPDTAFFCVNPFDWHFVIDHVKKSLTQQIAPPADYQEIVQRIVQKAGVHAKMPGIMIERRLRPHVPEVYEWVFKRFAHQCAQRDVRPLVIYRPATMDLEGAEPAEHVTLIRQAKGAGLEVIDLLPAFASAPDRNALVLARWDDHTTALGHGLLADKLYQAIVPLLAANLDDNTRNEQSPH